MGEKLEPIAQKELNVEWENVVKILALKSYAQADVMLNKYLLKHAQSDDTLAAKFSIFLHDEGFYRQAHGEEIACSMDFKYLNELFENSSAILSLIEQMSDIAKSLVYAYFDSFLIKLMSDTTIRYRTFEFLTHYRELIPSLQFEGITECGLRLASCIGASFFAEVQTVFFILERLCSLSPRHCCLEAEQIGSCLLINQNFEKALEFYLLALSCSAEEDKYRIWLCILYAKMKVRSEDEFIKCKAFSYENEEYIQLLLSLQNNPEMLKHVVDLADQNMKWQQQQQTGEHMAEKETGEKEDEPKKKIQRHLPQRKRSACVNWFIGAWVAIMIAITIASIVVIFCW